MWCWHWTQGLTCARKPCTAELHPQPITHLMPSKPASGVISIQNALFSSLQSRSTCPQMPDLIF